MGNPYPRLLKGFAALSEADQNEVLTLVESMAAASPAKPKPAPVVKAAAPEPTKTHICIIRGCYKFGHRFSDLGWFGEPGQQNGHIHTSRWHSAS